MSMTRINRRSLIQGAAGTAIAAAISIAERGGLAHAQSDWSPPAVSGVTFWTERSSVNYAFIVDNPNTALAIADAQFEATLYDGGGTVLETSTDSLAWLAPLQKIVLVEFEFLSDAQRVASVDVKLTEYEFRSNEPFSVENPVYMMERFGSYATGVVRNPYPRSVRGVRVATLLFDGGGAVIGGGSTTLEVIQPFGTAAARVSVVANGTPVRAEMYARLSSFGSFRD